MQRCEEAMSEVCWNHNSFPFWEEWLLLSDYKEVTGEYATSHIALYLSHPRVFLFGRDTLFDVFGSYAKVWAFLLKVFPCMSISEWKGSFTLDNVFHREVINRACGRLL